MRLLLFSQAVVRNSRSCKYQNMSRNTNTCRFLHWIVNIMWQSELQVGRYPVTQSEEEIADSYMGIWHNVCGLG